MQYSEFKKYSKLFEELNKEGIKFDIKLINFPSYYLPQNFIITSNHGSDYCHMKAAFLEINSAKALASIFTQLEMPITKVDFTLADKSSLKKLLYKGGTERSASVTPLSLKHVKEGVASVKYFYPGLMDQYAKNLLNVPSYHIVNSSGIYLITAPPEEILEGERTYRLLANTNGDIVACVDDQHKLYRRLDKGHILVFAAAQNTLNPFFVVDQLNLDVCCLIALYHVYPHKINNVLQDGVFLRGADARIALFKAERELPEKFQGEYQAIKKQIMTDFESSAQSLTLHKIQRGELPDVILNDIKITKNKVEYENITIESDLLPTVVYGSIDGNSQFSIYDILSILANNTETWLNELPVAFNTNNDGIHFASNASRTIKINGMDIVVEVKDKNTARYINGIRINQNEIARVLNRATCYHDVEKYNAFLKQVSKLSLYAHDFLSNGQRLKINPAGYNDYHAAKAKASQPKIKYVRNENGDYHLQFSEDKQVKIYRFISFVQELDHLNERANGGWTSRYTSHHRRDADWLKEEFKKLLLAHSVKKEGDATTLTDSDFTAFFKWTKDNDDAAEAKAKKLLSETMQLVGATEGKMGDMEGYFVTGKLHTYFIDSKTNLVYNSATKRNICIVNGKAEMGVGADAVVALLFALKNDDRKINQIQTLKNA